MLGFAPISSDAIAATPTADKPRPTPEPVDPETPHASPQQPAGAGEEG